MNFMTTGESKIPVFVSKPLATKFSTPLTNLSNRVRAHLSEPPKLPGPGILGLFGATSPISRTCKKTTRKTATSSPSTSSSPRPSKLFKPKLDLSSAPSDGANPSETGSPQLESGPRDQCHDNVSTISTPTPGSTTSGNVPVWEWTLGSAHSSSAGSLSQLQVRSGLNTLNISKHSSCELDESLGILTPDQMNDFTASIDSSLNRATSLEGFLVEKEPSQSETISDVKYNDNLEDALREDNLNESLNLLDGLKDYTSTAFDDNFSCSSNKLELERSPSVEDLPIDFPKPAGPPAVSIITSVTSIASLDGYQGDGELSRPASRGADHSPSAHQPIVKLKIVDPMTDSDFFTESDADVHEELQGIARGDRRAQVIDGTLYGGVPTSPAKTKSRNSHTEEMDSSGIYSDVDKMAANGNDQLSTLSDLIFQKVSAMQVMAASSQLQSVPETGLDTTLEPEPEVEPKEVQELNEKNKGLNSKPVKNVNEKKHKMPKRNVTSKIKAMLEEKPGNEENRQPATSVSGRTPAKKPVGKWDAVMSKIAQNKQEQEDKLKPCRLKEVKSKVFAGINLAPPKENQSAAGDAKNARMANSNSQRKGQPLRNLTITQSNSTRSLTSTKSKSRRCRNRSSESNLEITMKSADSISRGSSHESSLSEASDSISKTTSRSSKKSVEATSSTLAPTKKSSPASSPNQKKNVEPRKNPLRDQNRVANNLGPNVITSPPKPEAGHGGSLRRKGAQKSSAAPTPTPATNNNNINNNNNNSTCKNNTNAATHPAAKAVAAPANGLAATSRAQAELRHAAKAVESLSVLLQYLTSDLDAFSTPALKKELSKLKEEWLKTKLELEETQVSYRRLQDDTSSQQCENESAIKKLAEESKEELEQLHIEHVQQLEQLKSEHREELERLSKTHEEQLNELTRRLNEQSTELRTQFTIEIDCLHKKHADEKETISRQAKEEFDAYKLESEARLKKVTDEAKEREKILGERLNEIEQQHDALREQSRSIVDGMQNDRDSKVQVTSQYCRKLQDEVDSLRTVLDIRHAELQELRKQNECLQAEISEMPLIRQKMVSAQARVEDLSAQLQRKALFEKQLSEENRMLSDSLHCESEKKQKLTYTVEELQYKLKKTQEVASHLASIKDLSGFVDGSGLLSGTAAASSTPLEPKSNKLCRNLNREYESKELKGQPQVISAVKKPNTGSSDEQSEPKSPKVISVVKKSDSVSWVLEIDDPSEDVMSRLARKQSGRGLSQPNSSVSSPVRQDQVNRTEPKSRLHSQSSMSKKDKKPALRPRSISFNGEKVRSNSPSPKGVGSSHNNTNASEEPNYDSQYVTAYNWDELPGNDSPIWVKNVFANGDHFPESCKFLPQK
ncbi:uncharacterized protein [Bemisia tabaci]|uniref:uncharacterized protein isoform X1 n=1 Tax=Bemisia tabaci TaxID=7038 RepID=UPI003B289768